MPRPEFNEEEQYFLTAVQSDRMADIAAARVWACVVGGLIIAGCGAYYGNLWLMLAAFALLCALRLYEEFQQSKWTPVCRAVLAKYEAAIDAKETPDPALHE